MITGIPPFWFNSDLPDDLALAFIKDNIENIYNEGYIKSNIQKRYGFDVPKRGNYKISESAKLFLKKLIVFDQKERAGWKDL
jgi:predicted transcriptional regulator